MVRVETVSFPAFTGTESRRLYIYLPYGYRSHPEKRYPVLYMFDGHNVFFDSHATYGKSWGMKEYLVKHRTEVIIAAVECHHGEDDARMKEYSPWDYDFDEAAGKGYGDDTLRWFTEVLKPDIDRRFRTLPDPAHTWLMGSSMGGIMTTYGLLKYNHVFGKGCAVSPAYFLYPEKFYDLIARTDLRPGTAIYLDYGDHDLEMEPAMRAFRKVSDLLLEKNVYVTTRFIPGGVHNEASWEKQLPFCIGALFYE